MSRTRWSHLCARCGHPLILHDVPHVGGPCGWKTPRGIACECPKAAVALTPAEFRVLKLLASGIGEKQVSNVLNLSPRTVSAHSQNMLHKTGAIGVRLILAALRCGILSLDDLPTLEVEVFAPQEVLNGVLSLEGRLRTAGHGVPGDPETTSALIYVHELPCDPPAAIKEQI